jgi:CRISPR-associated protein Cas1
LPKKWYYKERTQHPGSDAFNATLNYLYGMGYSTVEKIIILSGLDPNAGFYHADFYGKPTLSFDLMELVRPLIDRTVVSLFTKRKVHDNWFEKQKNANNNEIILTKDGRKNLISEYVKNNQKDIESEIWKYCKRLTRMLEELK